MAAPEKDSRPKSKQPNDKPTTLEQAIKGLKAPYSDRNECADLEAAIAERKKILRFTSPADGEEIRWWHQALFLLHFHEGTIMQAISRQEQVVARCLGISSLGLDLVFNEEIIRVRGNIVDEVCRENAQKTPLTELPAAELWRRTQSFLDRLNALRRPPGIYEPPISGQPKATRTTRQITDRQITDRQITDRDRTNAKKKLNNPSMYPSMTWREVAATLGLNKSATYAHPELDDYPTGTTKRLWTTASVLAVLKSQRQ